MRDFIKMNEFTKVEHKINESVIAHNDTDVAHAVEADIKTVEDDRCCGLAGPDQSNGKGFTKPAITRLARRAGVKSMSDDCIVPLKHLVAMKLDEVLSTTLIVNSQHATKTIMPDDVYEALALCGINVARTEEF